MVSMKICGFLVLFCLTSLFECPSGMRLKKRDVETQTGTTLDSTVTLVPGTESAETSGEQMATETTMKTTATAGDEEESTQTEAPGGRRHHGHHHHHHQNGDDVLRYPDIQTSFMFNSPIFNIRQMEEYFRQLERTIHGIFQQTMDEAEQYPNTVSNTTSEEVTIDGQKYHIEKTIIKGGSENSTVVLKSVSIVPSESEQTNSTIVAL